MGKTHKPSLVRFVRVGGSASGGATMPQSRTIGNREEDGRESSFEVEVRMLKSGLRIRQQGDATSGSSVEVLIDPSSCDSLAYAAAGKPTVTLAVGAVVSVTAPINDGAGAAWASSPSGTKARAIEALLASDPDFDGTYEVELHFGSRAASGLLVRDLEARGVPRVGSSRGSGGSSGGAAPRHSTSSDLSAAFAKVTISGAPLKEGAHFIAGFKSTMEEVAELGGDIPVVGTFFAVANLIIQVSDMADKFAEVEEQMQELFVWLNGMVRAVHAIWANHPSLAAQYTATLELVTKKLEALHAYLHECNPPKARYFASLRGYMQIMAFKEATDAQRQDIAMILKPVELALAAEK